MSKAEERKRLRAAGFHLCSGTLGYITPYRLAQSAIFGIAIGVPYVGPRLVRRVYHQAADRLVAACERYAQAIDPRFGQRQETH